MCNPIAIAIAAQVAGGIVDAKGASDQAQADAATSRENAALDRVAAGDARARGGQQAGAARTATTAAVGRAIARSAASGLDPDAGTAADLQVATRAAGELEALTIQSDAARAAWGHEVRASQYDKAAKDAERNRKWAMLGGFLGTGGKVAQTYSSSKK